MQVPFILIEDGHTICEFEMSTIPGLDASFEIEGKFYKITEVITNEEGYTCKVRKINKKVHDQ